MTSSKFPLLFRWGGTALALCLVSGCSSSTRDSAVNQAPVAQSAAPKDFQPREEAPSSGSVQATPPPPAPPVAVAPARRHAPAPEASGVPLEAEKSAPADDEFNEVAPPPASKPAKKMEMARESKVAAKSRAGVEGGVQGGVVGGVVGGVLPGASIGAAPGGGGPGTPEPETRGNTFAEQKANAFTETAEDRLSTFAVDVDTASYTLARRYINQRSLPPPQAVRVEEFVNYFKYRYAPPERDAFRVHLEGAPSPFDASHHFVRVGIQGKIVSRSERKPAHLVFLVDTSGSMSQSDKLPLAKEAMKIAVKNLNENDTVALVTYAGGTRDVLGPTPATDLERIYKAIDSLESGGGTAMGSGMELAYRHAVKKASGKVVSRVVVLTDGDANIGQTSSDSMLRSIESYVKEGVTLSTIGFGMGNYRDDLMERLADKGNGNCFYIDSHKEARKVFEQQLTGTLEVIAKDVKVQVEFDPKVVRRYRLVGYENRDIADKDFREDKVDAGEIGAGHSVTALYEVELAQPRASLGTVRIRAKTPSGTEAAEQAFPFAPDMMRASLEAASADFRFALAVAASADVLRASPAAQKWNLATVQKLAEGATEGQSERAEFVQLLARARALRGSVATDGQ